MAAPTRGMLGGRVVAAGAAENRRDELLVAALLASEGRDAASNLEDWPRQRVAAR